MLKDALALFKNRLLSQPGDKMSAEITKSNRKVGKISLNHGENKYSITQYPNGTTVETRTTKRKK